MTPKQIAKKLNILSVYDLNFIEIRNDEIEVFVPDDDSLRRADYEKTEEIMHRAVKTLHWGGFKTGYGSWILRRDYASDMGDWNDKSSKWHY